MVDESQIQTAAVVFPVIVLITNVAINSVTPDDGRAYRIFVGGMGLVSLVTAMLGASFLFLGGLRDVVIPVAYSYLVASVVVLFFMALGIMVQEISRGLDAEADRLAVYVGIGVFLAFVLTIIFLV